jgi:hypothetical protein
MDRSGVAEKCLQMIMYMRARCEMLQNVCVKLVNHMIGLDVSAENETVGEVNTVTITPVAKDGSMTRYSVQANCGSEPSVEVLIQSHQW